MPPRSTGCWPDSVSLPKKWSDLVAYTAERHRAVLTHCLQCPGADVEQPTYVAAVEPLHVTHVGMFAAERGCFFCSRPRRGHGLARRHTAATFASKKTSVLQIPFFSASSPKPSSILLNVAASIITTSIFFKI